MHTDFLLDTFSKNRNNEAIIWKEKSFDYQWLFDRVHTLKKEVEKEKITNGTVVVLEADFSPTALALLLVLIDSACIIVPLTSSVESQKEGFIKIAEGEILIKLDDDDKDDITFNVIDWADRDDDEEDIDEDNESAYVIEAYGKMEDKRSVYLKINGFTPYFFVEIPKSWGDTNVKRFGVCRRHSSKAARQQTNRSGTKHCF